MYSSPRWEFKTVKLKKKRTMNKIKDKNEKVTLRVKEMKEH